MVGIPRTPSKPFRDASLGTVHFSPYFLPPISTLTLNPVLFYSGITHIWISRIDWFKCPLNTPQIKGK